MAYLHLLLLLFLSVVFSGPPVCSVSLSVYYEALCPYCSAFIVENLSRIFADGLISAVDLHLVPFGNAILHPDNSISCQHGPYECLLNALEACAISVWPDPEVHFKFIYCVESLVKHGEYNQWESCFPRIGLDSQPVIDCYNGGYGQQLELQYAAQTNALQPPHEYVPWVLVDGQPLYDGYDHFETYICRAFGGELPNACQGLSSTTIQEMKTNQADQIYEAINIGGLHLVSRQCPERRGDEVD